jgi:hypothetical protein
MAGDVDRCGWVVCLGGIQRGSVLRVGGMGGMGVVKW